MPDYLQQNGVTFYTRSAKGFLKIRKFYNFQENFV